MTQYINICFLSLFICISSAWSKDTSALLAPVFKAQAFDGKTFTYKPAASSKPTLFVFWASWCRLCRLETPTIIKLFKEYGADLNIVGISVDQSENKARGWIDRAKIPYLNLKDGQSKLADLFNVVATPSLLLVDKDGYIRYRSSRMTTALVKMVSNVTTSQSSVF